MDLFEQLTAAHDKVAGPRNDQVEFHVGHVVDVLRAMPESSVHCVVTSPPYWGLRDYGVSPVTWGDGWTGCLGLEPTPDQYITHLTEVFEEVRRVLRPDGTLWLNLGDSYARNPSKGGTGPPNGRNAPCMGYTGEKPIPDTMKEKDLVGIPWMAAFALRDAGWYLRNDIVWAKGVSGQREIEQEIRTAMLAERLDPNTVERVIERMGLYVGSCMPESVRDRLTRSHEYVFLFGHPDSRGRYFYDSYAIREPFSGYTQDAIRKAGSVGGPRPDGNNFNKEARKAQGSRTPRTRADRAALLASAKGRNRRSVWTLPTRPYKEAHFAVFPPDLVEPCVLAGTSAHGCCADCGAPWRREVSRPSPHREGEMRANARDGSLTAEEGLARAGISHLQHARRLADHPPKPPGGHPHASVPLRMWCLLWCLIPSAGLAPQPMSPLTMGAVPSTWTARMSTGI